MPQIKINPDEVRARTDEVADQARKAVGEVGERARKTVDETGERARKALTEARETVQHAADEQTVVSALRDGAYATVGAGDAVVRRLRSVGEWLRDADREQVETRVRDLRAEAARGYSELVARGRKVVDDVGVGSATERARAEAKRARAQAKGAVTSARKAGETVAQTATGAAEKVGTGPALDTPIEERNVHELRELARQRDIPGRTGMNKAELVRALKAAEEAEKAEKAEEPAEA